MESYIYFFRFFRKNFRCKQPGTVLYCVSLRAIMEQKNIYNFYNYIYPFMW